jgi:hypothetical protein
LEVHLPLDEAVMAGGSINSSPPLRKKIAAINAGTNFRAEFFNIFNHPNFGQPNNNPTDPRFGQSTQMLASFLGSGGANGGFNPLYQIGGPRSSSH